MSQGDRDQSMLAMLLLLGEVAFIFWLVTSAKAPSARIFSLGSKTRPQFSDFQATLA